MVLENTRVNDVKNVATSHDAKSYSYAFKLCEIRFFYFKTNTFMIHEYVYTRESHADILLTSGMFLEN